MFQQDSTKPDAQAVRDKDSISAGTTGPYAPANSNPASYRNKFVSELKKNPPSYNFYSQVFSAQDAQESQNKINSLGPEPNFPNPGDRRLAKDFLDKYTQGGERGLVPQNQMITQQTVAAFQSQQPGQGIGDGNVTAASRIKYPGASGTQTS